MLLSLLVFTSIAVAHEFQNATPYDLYLDLDVMLGLDKHVEIPKNQTTDVPVGLHLIRGAVIKGIIGNQKIKLAEHNSNLGLGGIKYRIFVEPFIQKQPIPGGYAEQTTHVKLYLMRDPRGPIYPGGVVDETEKIELNR